MKAKEVAVPDEQVIKVDRKNPSADTAQLKLPHIPEDVAPLPLWRSASTGKRSSSGNNNSSNHHQHSSRNFERNASLTMEEVAALMREQDAELLESIHHLRGANDSTANTPVLLAQNDENNTLFIPSLLSTSALPVVDTMPDLSLDDVGNTLHDEGQNVEDSGTHQTEPSTPPGDAPLLHERRLSLRNNRNVDDSSNDESLHVIAADPAVDHHIRVEHRHALSGEVWTQAIAIIEPPAAVAAAARSSSQDTAATAAAANKVDVTAAGLLRAAAQHHSKDERRFNEAAQFAEAVGDDDLLLEPARVSELRIIDEAEEDDRVHDSDDDDAPEVRLDGAANSSSATDDASAALPTAASRDANCELGDVTGTVKRGNLADALGRAKSPKTRPQWPFTRGGFLDKLPDAAVGGGSGSSVGGGFIASSSHEYVYKGIHSNPPQVVRRGTDRGNYALLHRKAWLEVSDKYHRYGKNLRLYYRYWERLGCPTNMFFDWLDSKGEAAGQPLPELDDCLRARLDSDTVLYISNPDVTDRYALRFVPADSGCGRCVDVDGDPVVTGTDGWIFVLRDNVIYGGRKITSITGHHSKQRFHHSSFFGGKAVAAAGIFITDEEGILQRLYPHSGHYRPGEAHMQRMLYFLYQQGIDLQTLEMDTQQILHVSRDEVKNDKGDLQHEKKKKVESLHLLPAGHVACFLAHKARFIGEGIFAQIHRIRKVGATSVTEALEIIDNRRFNRVNADNDAW